jgi:hypothetical protein
MVTGAEVEEAPQETILISLHRKPEGAYCQQEAQGMLTGQIAELWSVLTQCRTQQRLGVQRQHADDTSIFKGLK